MPNSGIKISVIVCTYNREKYLGQLLESMARQSYPKDLFEVVLVNNNSVDGTENICRQFANQHPDVHFIYVVEAQQGLSYARNRGIHESSGELLVYVDDDATVEPSYLKAYGDFFDLHPEAIAAGGPIYPVFETKAPRWMSHFTQNLIGGALYQGKEVKAFKHGKYPGGGNAMYRRQAFEQFGLFNPELGRKGNSLMGAEEKDIFDRYTRAGKPFYYVPQAFIYHHIPAEKLTSAHFQKLTCSIGMSERVRTLSVSKKKYAKRIFSECVKWAASIVLSIGYTICLQPAKGVKLLQLRWNVTKGLVGLSKMRS